MRTKLSTCRRKLAFADEAEAMAARDQFGLPLYPYRCDRCHRIHLTGRTKGKRTSSANPRPVPATEGTTATPLSRRRHPRPILP
jgi:cytochrome c5